MLWQEEGEDAIALQPDAPLMAKASESGGPEEDGKQKTRKSGNESEPC